MNSTLRAAFWIIFFSVVYVEERSFIDKVLAAGLETLPWITAAATATKDTVLTTATPFFATLSRLGIRVRTTAKWLLSVTDCQHS